MKLPLMFCISLETPVCMAHTHNFQPINSLADGCQAETTYSGRKTGVLDPLTKCWSESTLFHWLSQRLDAYFDSVVKFRWVIVAKCPGAVSSSGQRNQPTSIVPGTLLLALSLSVGSRVCQGKTVDIAISAQHGLLVRSLPLSRSLSPLHSLSSRLAGETGKQSSDHPHHFFSACCEATYWWLVNR